MYEIFKCEIIEFYDFNYILIKRKDFLNKNRLVNLVVMRNIEIYKCLL